MELKNLKKNKKGEFIIPKSARKRKEKAWITFQLPVELRDEVSKACDKLNLNLSKYLRAKVIDIVKAAKLNRRPKDNEEAIPVGSKLEEDMLKITKGLT